MSVYTVVEKADAMPFLENYHLGQLSSLDGIIAGIENTNYFLQTTKGTYVLTLYERMAEPQLDFVLGLMHHLANLGLPVPQPQILQSADASRPGATLSELEKSTHFYGYLNGKPSSLITKLPGGAPVNPTLPHCNKIGTLLGLIHRYGQSFPLHLSNPRGSAWVGETQQAIQPFLDASQKKLLDQALEQQNQYRLKQSRGEVPLKTNLPQGAIHGDLFCDNTLWVDEQLTGIIDFGFAATDTLAYDLAITVNAWCNRPDGSLNWEQAKNLCDHYQRQRPLLDSETLAWPNLLQAAALRFWLSRLYDSFFPRKSLLTHSHDPKHFALILEHHLTNPQSYQALFS